MDLKEHIRVIRDVPEEGFVVYDTSTLLLDPLAWWHAIDGLAKIVSQYEPDILAGIESRGFLLAAPLAYKLGLGFVTVHRPGTGWPGAWNRVSVAMNMPQAPSRSRPMP